MNQRWSILSVVLLVAACGGKSKPPAPPPPPPVEAKAPPPPPPPPVCIPAVEPAVIGTPNADEASAQFCVSDDGGAGGCFAVALDDGKYAKLDEAPAAQRAALEVGGSATVETTATEVKVCAPIEGSEDAACTTLRPKVARGATEPLAAAIDSTGANVVVALGASGKGYLEVWNVAKKKKTATIKYGKGDYRCGQASMLGDTIFVNASVCAGPDARGALYNLKGKKLADVGGKDFGTYGTAAVQVDGSVWAFLESGAGAVVLQDVTTGAVGKSIDLVGLWAGDDASDGALASGNPGESVLVRGGDGKLVVIAGSPRVGNVGVVDLSVGEVQVWKALPCAAPAAAPADDAGAAPTDE